MENTNSIEIKINNIDEAYEVYRVLISDENARKTNQKVILSDPLYNQEHEMNVYNVDINDKIVTFAAGELSNCVYGFFVNE